MEPVSAPGYDRFKTVVAFILAVIIILMLLRGCATSPASPAPTQMVAVPDATETFTPLPASTEVVPVTGAADVTLTPSATALPPTVEPTVTAIAVESPTPTPTTAATEVPATTPTQATPTQGQNAACNTSAPSHLAVGQTARVIRRLNMRSNSSINATILQTNPTNTQVEIIGGPVCEPIGERAYLWWQIRLPNGAEGWSAETSLSAGTYFLEAVP